MIYRIIIAWARSNTHSYFCVDAVAVVPALSRASFCYFIMTNSSLQMRHVLSLEPVIIVSPL